jgi:hypothetical protein
MSDLQISMARREQSLKGGEGADEIDIAVL